MLRLPLQKNKETEFDSIYDVSGIYIKLLNKQENTQVYTLWSLHISHLTLSLV